MKILVTGGCGFIGSHCCSFFCRQGHDVLVLTHRKKTEISSPPSCKVLFDLDDELPPVDVIINLAGASIAAKYLNARREKELLTSRIKIMDHLLTKYNGRPFPKIFIQASATGIYPSHGRYDENGPTNGEFGELISNVEQATLKRFATCSMVTLLRFGIVIGHHGGLMAILSGLPRLLFFPNPQNKIPWISIDDATRALLFLCEHPQEGIVNATDPQELTINELLTLDSHSKWYLPLPKVCLYFPFDKRLALLRVSHSVISHKLLSLGFIFQGLRK